ncbi:DUF429 domain-containing protein [Methylobacterium sp. E-005]|uniref:DUF429 domain-containing protein n=1 Tax=Methylobacterium sp. E-005 TaxID=2836549 RepID=UPI001FBAB587|nr:DUF429 domain-containing protein [Methylobacterium sp. E-005]MCJ2086451.1 DUF429 domain-containing protein [Methylobacterium sp. E-005]
MPWIAGADGFKSQWCVVLQNVESGELRARICPSFAGLLTLAEKPSVITVDIPIGLPEVTRPGGRLCEQQARKILGSRASSVFSAVGRAALRAHSQVEADQISRDAGGLGVGAHAWGLAEKLREADAVMTPERQHLVREVHPEVSFWAMNGRSPLPAGKKTLEGMLGRMDALEAEGFPSTFVRQLPVGLRVGRDDFLDACAALWTARRISAGLAERLPEQLDLDSRGLDQAIWF